ncbi:dynamin family protein [Candidatus Marithrix sp. Canyon 246]|uniref:dynamin family protein n=1 Tax=Candidatus Marithrix sp. Canyon 246 TaxID=1827136 RepID=UPI00084A1581|nr:dynamin family protein [Candidatus Marithrix sp. Canyon 246]
MADTSINETFSELDNIAQKLGFLSPEQSYTDKISVWPMISILGVYSAGKSSFINHYLGQTELQRSGMQAVDDKFTVICFSDDESNQLPSLALDADPRFPFYKIGKQITAYLQLKSCPIERLKGKILIDSPGFDADQQRTATLEVTQHILDLSDLVLVFFDARRPEPGSMPDTLKHLVAETINRPDFNKFMFILNQMDTTAKDDNPEDVVAAWQAALAEAGLTGKHFYRIYNPDAAIEVEDQNALKRLEKKSQTDMQEIHKRMDNIEIERTYRLIAIIEDTAKDIQNNLIPQLQNLLKRWKKRVLVIDGILFVTLAVVIRTWLNNSEIALAAQNPIVLGLFATGTFILLISLHLNIAKLTANHILKRTNNNALAQAFLKNTGTSRSLFMIFIDKPVAWGNKMRSRIAGVLSKVNHHVQELNNTFANPDGLKAADDNK